MGDRKPEGRLPMAERDVEDLPGHWLLARLGKRVLRPGGIGLTRALLDAADVAGADVVELAPGLGRTAQEIVPRRPASYTGIERDEAAAGAVRRVVGSAGRCLVADAAATGLPDGCADVVVGEAMLTMQSDRGKDAVVAEAARLLRPGGRYAIHELVADEGPVGAARFVRNVLRDRPARERVLRMRTAFREHRDSLRGIAIVARRVGAGES
jgi:SAM-dependent methyltransferase